MHVGSAAANENPEKVAHQSTAIEMPIVGKVGKITETRGGGTFEWEIGDFFSLSSRVDDGYRSTVFNFWDSRWYLRLHPNGERLFSTAGWVTLYLMRDDSGSPKTVRCTYGIKGSQKEEKSGEFKYEFSKNKGVFGECSIAKFWSRSDWTNRKSTLMPNNVLTITCHLRSDDTFAIKDYSDSSTQTDSNLEIKVLPEAKPSTEKQGAEELRESLKRLLAGGEDSDCVIKVRDKEFPAHRVILRARSPVFQAMFAHDTLEKQNNFVTIEDCDPETFPAFLEHVYTGGVKIISSRNVFGLYAASEKYDLPALKEACSEFLKGNLTVASFCEAITLAVKYSDKELVEVATEFFCSNTLDIIKTAEWQIFLAENPTVGNELHIKKLRK